MIRKARYEFRIEAYPSANLVLVELRKIGETKTIAARSVPKAPENTFASRVQDAKAWLAWSANISRQDISDKIG